MMPWPGRPTVGVKTEAALEKCRSQIGETLFKPPRSFTEQVENIACHEFTHACTAHLKLPPWFNEGLAMRTVDLLVGECTVKSETRTDPLVDPTTISTRSYRRASYDDHQSILNLYAAGFWATKHLDQTSHLALVELLSKKRPAREINRIVRELLRQ